MDLPPDYAEFMTSPSTAVRHEPPRPPEAIGTHAWAIETTMEPPAAAGGAGQGQGGVDTPMTLQQEDIWIFLSRYVNGAGFDRLARRLGLPESQVEQRFNEFCSDLARELSDPSFPLRRP